HDGPQYERPYARPDWQDALQADRATGLARPTDNSQLRQQWLRLMSSPDLADKSWITNQYDRYVRGNTVLSQPENAGMVRIDANTNLGVAIATDCNSRFVKLDP